MGLPVKKEMMFANLKGIEKKGIKKRQLKLLKQVDFLSRFLKPGEEVYLVTTACSPVSVLEQLTIGAISQYIKRALLVFTNRRIFHIPATASYHFRHSIAQIRYNDCRKVTMGWRTLKFEYKNGKRERFPSIHAKERNKISALVQKLDTRAEPGRYRQRYHLCPSCSKSLLAGRFSCPRCRLEFKSRTWASILSLVIPGGGYFFTGHWLLGVMAFTVESILLILAVTGFTGAHVVAGQQNLDPMIIPGMLIVWKSIAVYHAGRFVDEFIPVRTDYKKRALA